MDICQYSLYEEHLSMHMVSWISVNVHWIRDICQCSLDHGYLSMFTGSGISVNIYGIMDICQCSLDQRYLSSERAVCNAVSPAKDVDGFNVVSVGKFCQDLKCLLPATPAGVMELLRRTGVETFGKNAVVAGRSKNVGMPIAMLLHADGIGETQAGDATTTICHRYTPPEQLRHFVKYADIVVVAAGIPGLITGDMLKPGCAVIDVGINRIKDPETGKNKIVGDCDFDSCSEVAGWITPVPGGVGPMTVAMLMKNTLQAAQGAYKKP
ncbi:bifunctional methylenetetrahydrofolate dehydrogenase/cyclohydrolase, mitochondrial-like isoform X2 [Watersipora subatra]|uniref:bifunctional methylenetetrahydrofolate dehydrogenase/cyclohydrolase, mitochondrial-like isoform X2 n=1 Tax=Watersipora subatra TaxID=2589382 RepID=UPI00355C0909